MAYKYRNSGPERQWGSVQTRDGSGLDLKNGETVDLDQPVVELNLEPVGAATRKATDDLAAKLAQAAKEYVPPVANPNQWLQGQPVEDPKPAEPVTAPKDDKPADSDPAATKKEK